MKRNCYLIFIALVTLVGFTQCESSNQARKAKYVFYFIGDGMGVNQVNGTEMFLAEQEGRVGVKPLNFSQFPVVSFASTYSRYNSVTCSAAAGTALATGQKTKNGTIGMDSLQTTPLYSVAVKAKEMGKKVGIATSVSIDHATPAAFYAHQPSRKMAYEIATDLPKTGFDFYAGSGFLEPSSKKDSLAPTIFTVFADSGYVVAKGYEAFNAQQASAKKMILMQHEGAATLESIPFAIDRKTGDLTLEQITESAIRFLSKEKDKGFFLMVEGGKIDWACHGNDAATVFHEVMDLAAAVQKAYDFYQQHPDETLIIITADHETGGIALGTGEYALNLKALQNQKLSQEGLTTQINQLREQKNNVVAWEDVKALLTEQMGFWEKITLSEQQEKRLKDTYVSSFSGKNVILKKSEYAQDEPLAAIAKEILNEIALVGWTSGGHSAGYVPVYAIGAGSQLFQGKMENTDIPKKIIEAME